MLKNNQKTYQLFNKYCIRTPLFPIQFYKKYENFTETALKEILLNTVFREAIFLASPELYHQIIRWEKGNLIDKQKVEKLQFSILKYSTRISTRCTPFGLFASCTTGKFDVQTNIQLKENTEHQRFTRFDTTFLTQLFQELLKQKAIKEAILFYPNTSIYKIGTHYRYVEYTIEKKKRSYSIEGIVYAEYIETILHLAKKGKTISELAFTLIDNEITKKEAISFIEELIDHQILVSELEITVTGNDYFKNLLHRIQQIPEASEIYNQLSVLQKQLTQLDAKIGNQIDGLPSLFVTNFLRPLC